MTNKKIDLKLPQFKPLLYESIRKTADSQASFLISEAEINQHRSAVLHYAYHNLLLKLKLEKSFHAQKNNYMPLKSGMLLKVDFGLTIGAEFGGLHYAIVLKDSSAYDPLVTVVPLKSFKTKVHKTEINLGNSIYKALQYHLFKIEQLGQEALKNLNQVNVQNEDTHKKLIAIAEREGFAIDEKSFDLLGAIILGSNEFKYYYNEALNLQNEKLSEAIQEVHKQHKIINTVSREVDNFKTDSVAVINQLRTISKMRISMPQNRISPLYGITLDKETLLRIREKVKKYLKID
ncbi:hypothetical protein [Veillonella magna]|uniref:hypothetical protein n=1 Tax=Veillonella magna TaxID=464322 RepID=UPI0023EF5D0D|nr:hypothetical protein [Veillonella magna]